MVKDEGKKGVIAARASSMSGTMRRCFAGWILRTLRSRRWRKGRWVWFSFKKVLMRRRDSAHLEAAEGVVSASCQAILKAGLGC